MRCAVGPLLLLLWIVAPSPASGQTSIEDDARAAARTTGYEGVAAFEQGRYEEAHEKLDRAYELMRVHTLGLWSARAMVKRGLLVAAAERYLEVARMPVVHGDAAVQSEARDTAAR